MAAVALQNYTLSQRSHNELATETGRVGRRLLPDTRPHLPILRQVRGDAFSVNRLSDVLIENAKAALEPIM